MVKENTIVIPVVRTDLVEKCLETLYRHTPPNFYVYIIDNSADGIDKEIIRKYVHFYVRPGRNLGFSKSFNTGLKLCETKYITTCNDDIEFIDSRWWDGILETFDRVDTATPQRPCMLVTPSSIKLPDWSVGRPSGDHFYIKEYKEFYTPEDWDSLVNEEHYVNQYLTIKPKTVIDGVTLYCSVFKTDIIREIGGLDERYYPGSGEDYDLCCRTNMIGYRSVGTTSSWVFHHWSSSLSNLDDFKKIIDPDRMWNKTEEAWDSGFDIWGKKCPVCEENMRLDKESGFATCSKNHTQFEIPAPFQIPL